MRRYLRRFAAVGSVVTIIDLVLFGVLARAVGLSPTAADALSVLVAAVSSYLLNRAITFGGDPYIAWVHEPAAYAALAVTAGAVDVAVVSVVAGLGSGSNASLVLAKGAALVLAGGLRVACYRRRLFRKVRAGQEPRPDRAPPPGDVRLTVVVPAYHEAERIGTTLGSLRQALAPLAGPGGVEVVVVDDGSGDETGPRAVAAGADRVIVLPENRGKGAAVRAGVLAARGRTVAYLDADLAYSPDQILPLLEQIEAGYDVVVGSRRHLETVTVVKAGRLREVSGRAFNLLSEVVLLGNYRDTQCGIKALRSDAARLVFGRSRVDGFAFEIEVFHLAERYGLSLAEMPVRVTNSAQSTVRVVADSLEMVGDLLRIRRWAGRGVYDLSPAEAGPVPLAQAGPVGAVNEQVES